MPTKHPRLITHFSTVWFLPAHYTAPISPAEEILCMKSTASEKYLVTFQDLPIFLFPESVFEGWMFWKFSYMNDFGVESVPIILFKILYYLKQKLDTDWISAVSSLLSLWATGCREWPFRVVDPFLGVVCPGSIPLGLANLPHLLRLITLWNKDSGTISILMCDKRSAIWLIAYQRLSFSLLNYPCPDLKLPYYLAAELFKGTQSVTLYTTFSIKMHLYRDTSNNCWINERHLR